MLCSYTLAGLSLLMCISLPADFFLGCSLSIPQLRFSPVASPVYFQISGLEWHSQVTLLQKLWHVVVFFVSFKFAFCPHISNLLEGSTVLPVPRYSINTIGRIQLLQGRGWSQKPGIYYSIGKPVILWLTDWLLCLCGLQLNALEFLFLDKSLNHIWNISFSNHMELLS